VTVGDPVASGLVERLDRPSGNVTGFATAEASLGGKWLELDRRRGDPMNRREFIAGSVAAWPVVARAQQPPMPVVGHLGLHADFANFTFAFLQGLKETGYVEGQNVAVEYRWADDQADQLPALAADLVRRRVAVIVAGSTPAAVAAKAATTTIPIVFTSGADPVALGLAATFNRPGGNVTGSVSLAFELAPKRLQLLRELIPNAAVFGVLADPAFPPTQSTIADLQAAARTLGLQLTIGHLEKLISMPISDLAGVNIYESEREQSRIIRRQFCGERPVGAIFRGALLYMPEPTAILKRRSQLFPNSMLVRSLLATVRSSPCVQNNSRRWRLGTHCPPFSHTVSTLWPAA
jgi:hypothetical protein